MKENLETRTCHYCNRNSWVVAQGQPCPSCHKRTGKYHHLINHVLIAFSILGLCAVAYITAML
jgi:hypothetical protein